MSTTESTEKLPPELKIVGNSQDPCKTDAHVKSPRRVAAGRLNQKKRKPLSMEARERLRQAMFRNRPWERATGPRTAEGKAISARNRRRRSSLSALLKELRDLQRGVVDPAAEMRRTMQKFLDETDVEATPS